MQQLPGWVAALALWAGVLAVPVLAQSDSKPAEVVGMTATLEYDPDTVRVEAGQTIRWENSTVIRHTVTADPEKATMDESVRLPDGASPFDSGDLNSGDTFDYTFDVPGTYRYFCIPHEGAKMYGTVIVEPADD